MSGDLPEGWQMSKMGDLVYLAARIGWRGLKADEYTKKGPRFLSVYNLNYGDAVDFRHMTRISQERYDESPEIMVKEGDVLLVKDGAGIGKLGIVRHLPEPATLNSSLLLVRAEHGLSSEFVFRFLSGPTLQRLAQNRITGSTTPHLFQRDVRTFDFPVPPLNEQKRIVAKIDALTEKSREARQALDEVPALLDQLRQSILAAAFRGDLTKKWREQNPNVEPASVLLDRTELPGGKSTGRAAGEQIIEGRAALSVGDPELPVPDGWLRVSMLRVARLESGHTPSRKHPEWWGGDIPWIGIGDARDNHGRTILVTEEQTNDKGLANSAARLLPKDTVCLSRTASVGYVTKMGVPMATSQDFVNWICTSALLPDYLLYAFLAEGEHLLKFGKGSTHTTIYFPEVKAFHIALPPLAEQEAIVRLVKDRLAVADRLMELTSDKRSTLRQLDPAILAKAFRGELVPQDPNDEPASLLLERIRQEREAGGSVKKSKGKQKA